MLKLRKNVKYNNISLPPTGQFAYLACCVDSSVVSFCQFAFVTLGATIDVVYLHPDTCTGDSIMAMFVIVQQLNGEDGFL